MLGADRVLGSNFIRQPYHDGVPCPRSRNFQAVAGSAACQPPVAPQHERLQAAVLVYEGPQPVRVFQRVLLAGRRAQLHILRDLSSASYRCLCLKQAILQPLFGTSPKKTLTRMYKPEGLTVPFRVCACFDCMPFKQETQAADLSFILDTSGRITPSFLQKANSLHPNAD